MCPPACCTYPLVACLPQSGLNAVWMQCGSATVVWPCMGQLANFTCRSCGLTGALPNSYFTANLTQLLLPHNQLSGPIAGPTAALTGPSRLRVLDVSYNSLSDIREPSFWGYVGKDLQKLFVQGNAFVDVALSGECVRSHRVRLTQHNCMPTALAATQAHMSDNHVVAHTLTAPSGPCHLILCCCV
jgi:hypothetical protein